MRPAFSFLSPGRPPLQLRRRTLVLLLVIVAHLLLMLLLLRMTPTPGMPDFAGRAIELLPDLSDDREEEEEDPQDEAEIEPEVAEPVVVDETPPPPVVEQPYDLSIIRLTREEFAAADIARLPPPERPADGAAQPGDSVPVGRNANGEPIYNAEWQREPTSAELAYYLPASVPRPGWALIACQTAPRFRVENCQELGQSPAWGRLASGVREAAWQFRVRPPRKGGKPILGAWVQIRIDFLEAKADEGR
jgi:protein TonB